MIKFKKISLVMSLLILFTAVNVSYASIVKEEIPEMCFVCDYSGCQRAAFFQTGTDRCDQFTIPGTDYEACNLHGNICDKILQ